MRKLVSPALMLLPMTFHERLKASREKAKLTQAQVAKRVGVTQSAYQQWESGQVFPRRSKHQPIATCLKVDLVWLFQGRHDAESDKQRTVPLVGYVGAGAQIFPVDDHLKGAGLEQVDAPPIENIKGIVAVRVRGDSMVPAYFDGNIIYYGAHEGDPAGAVGEEVVACLHDGRIMVKRLARGHKPGHFNLVSYSGVAMEDVRLQWVALILWVKKGRR